MPGFKGNGSILLQPTDLNRNYVFHLTTCTSETSNDGVLPYLTTIESIKSVVAYNTEGEAVGDLVVTDALSTPDITLTLKYPSTSGPGRYKITMTLVISDNSEMELDFHRITCKDK